MNRMILTVPSKRASLWLMLGLNVLFFFITQFQYVSLVVYPLRTFTTGLHEFGHAAMTYATGGIVTGLTMVPDGEGAGGLTFHRGGIGWLVSSAGYLGTALFGSLLIWFGRKEENASPVLKVLGVVFALGCLICITPGLLDARHGSEAILSLLIGLAIAGTLVFSAQKFSPLVAHFMLLILAGQTALSSLTDVWYLIQISVGFSSNGSFSDATNMAQHTGIPAAVWSIVWGAISLLMVVFTLKVSYQSAPAVSGGNS
ncbi:MAG: M50 family metallopeptidase [Candidatus Melainabacteria bacterium]|nr:M50 family metallopeptidase [Candidatus Melainabacteria bacterium]